MNMKSEEGWHILVDQTSDSNLELLDLLKELDEEFIIYGFNKASPSTSGHLLSLPHSTFYRCLMNGALTLAEADARPAALCPVCRAKLCWNLAPTRRRVNRRSPRRSRTQG